MQLTDWSISTPRKVFDYDGPQVMGIINVTPDSFYAGSRIQEADQLRQRARQILDEGGTMIDVGAYSTRPDAAEVSAEEELARLRFALPIIRETVGEDVPISVDTFRASVAEACVSDLGADIINDVSGGTLDEGMFDVVARTHAPYILMHMRGTPSTMQSLTDYPDGVTAEVKRFFCQQMGKLLNVARSANIILDPGFGFAKTLSQNYELMDAMDDLVQSFSRWPILVGISRKSMIYRLLGTDAEHALNGTTVLNTYAVEHGAAILRVHDVKEAVEVVRMVQLLKS